MEQEQSPWVRSPLLSACLGGASIGGHLLHTLWPLGPAPVENPLCELRKQNKSQVRGQGLEGHEEEVVFFFFKMAMQLSLSSDLTAICQSWH